MGLKSPPIALKISVTEESVQKLAIAYTKHPASGCDDPLHIAAGKILFAWNLYQHDLRAAQSLVASAVDRKRSLNTNHQRKTKNGHTNNRSKS